ncbi:hypothetical protein [Clostridioides difficile]
MEISSFEHIVRIQFSTLIMIVIKEKVKNKIHTEMMKAILEFEIRVK